MKPVLRWGAITVLLLIVTPIALGRNPLLVGPTWWLIAYVAFRGLLPAAKQPLAPLLAALGGLLAVSIDVILGNPKAWPPYFDAVVLVAGALWLYLTLSRTAAGALLVLQIFSVAIFLVAFSLMPEAHGDRFAISLAVITTLQRAVAIYLLAEFVWRRKPEPDVAPVFD